MTEEHVKILLVEDDAGVAAELATALTRQGWHVEHAADAPAGMHAAAQKAFSAIILDRILKPAKGAEVDGISVLQRLRAMNVRTPVLILSALGGAPERVKGLNFGADDYLAKPFTIEEVVARLRALIRRSNAEPHPEVIVDGPIELWTKAGRALLAGKAISLSPKEFKLLQLLVENSGESVTKRMILERVFNWRASADPGTGVVEVHIYRLRKKLEAAGGNDLVKTARGDGYYFDRDVTSAC